MPPIPKPNGLYLQLPPHHRAPKNESSPLSGLPYATIAAYNKSISVWKLIHGLEISVGLYCQDDDAVEAKATGVTGTAADDEEANDEEEEVEPKTMQSLVKACARLHTQLNSMYNLKHQGFTQFELSQIILKVLTLLCATVEVRLDKKRFSTSSSDDGDGEVTEGEVQKGVENMALNNNNNNNSTNAKKKKPKRRVKLHFDNMGCILGGQFTQEEEKESMLKTLDDGRRVIDLGEQVDANDAYYRVDGNLGTNLDAEDDAAAAKQQLEQDLSRQLALPSPARESLLSVALLLLSQKEQLRSVANSALFDDPYDTSRWMLILNYRSLLTMLLRTAPYLDEHKAASPPKNSSTRTSTVLKRTVQLIRSCRKFFDQGIRPPNYTGGYVVPIDDTANTLWDNLKNDLIYHSHSNSCFRALIMMYLFHPSKCSAGFYERVMPTWMECWRNVDRCPEYDFLWMVLFCRGRKHVAKDSGFDWGELRRYLLTMAGYWLQLPVGGVSADKTFPRAVRAAKRSFPRNLKLFVGSESKYEEGIDFVGRLAKLLIYCSGPFSNNASGGSDDMECECEMQSIEIDLSEGTRDILRFFSFVKPYFNPSNVGTWTFPIGAFLHYLSYELCHRVGIMAALVTLKSERPETARQLFLDEPHLSCINLPGNEIVAYLDTLLPLCQQALYSKNGTVSHAGETAMLYLSQIDPHRVSAPMLDFSMQALGISSVNLSHQAPAALSALSRLLQPSLRYNPQVVLSRLPEMLQLSLAGIDSNDQNKTTRTLIFYRNLLMWIPCGGRIPMPKVNQDEVLYDSIHDGTIEVGKNLMKSRYSIIASTSYETAMKALPLSSVFNQVAEISAFEDTQPIDALLEEAMMAINDWTLPFLDRVFELLRAAGEQEKSKGYGVGSTHAMADAALAKNVSRILKETLTLFFASMDGETYETASRYVTNFISEETLPFAVKDASVLCQAVAATRFGTNGDAIVDTSPGLDALVPILTEDLQHRSNKSAIYRLRCLAGAVRYSGRTVLKHRESIVSAIKYALSKSDDKSLLKTGCKLLRHTLASQCEEYPIAQCCHPLRVTGDSGAISLGTSARLKGDKVLWHVPSGEQIDFSVGLLDDVALSPLRDLGRVGIDSNLQQWRKCLRILRYSLRGCISLLLDDTPDAILQEDTDICPREMASALMIKSASSDSQTILNGLRHKLCLVIIDMQSLIVTDTVEEDSQVDALPNGDRRKNASPLSRDPKVCSEVCELADLLLDRRGAHHNSGSALSVWKGQKEILSDFVLTAQTDYIISARARANDAVFQGAHDFYFDGEDGGNTVSRGLLVSGTDLVMQSLTGHASTQIPRRLRKRRGPPSVQARVHLFSLGMTYEKLQSSLISDFKHVCPEQQGPLEAYEGLIDGLCAMACHPNINVRGDAIGIVEYAFTRYGWVIKPRIPRLVSAFALRDDDQHVKFGVLSCAQLVDTVDHQGKRTRLAEAMKGVIKLLGSPKVISGLLSSEELRLDIAQRLCTTQRLQSLLPHEELAKFIHYVTTIFLSIRSRFYSLPRATETDQVYHEAMLNFLLESLDSFDTNTKTKDTTSLASDVEIDAAGLHWKNRLMVVWFLMNSIDETDLMIDDPIIMSRIWKTCIQLIETEAGQPIQRVTVGLLGRLVSLALVDMSQIADESESVQVPDISILRDAFVQDKFCRTFAFAVAFDHREDSSVGGGHGAQWSAGVEEMLRDATTNLSPKTMYPFQRISQTSGAFKTQHCQLVEGILRAIGRGPAEMCVGFLLDHCKELVSAPPSEDQKNQLVASAEIFGGVCRALLNYSSANQSTAWEELLLPFLDEAVQKMPSAFITALFDGIRYGIHHFPPRLFHPLLKWCVTRVQATLWQHENMKDDAEEGCKLTDRFALQSKYLLLVQAVLLELDNEDDIGAACLDPWYTNIYLNRGRGSYGRNQSFDVTSTEAELGRSWKFVSESLIPYLLNAIGHPYESCRDRIASLLFRMCYCHRKFLNMSKSHGSDSDSVDPGLAILKKLISIRSSSDYEFKEKVRALGSARKFITCCAHWGDSKHEFSEYIIPLLPLVFESLQPMEGEVSAENRGLEAELVKGYRYNVADVSTNCIVSYGVSEDMTRVLKILITMAEHDWWQIRQATAHFLRCFQGSHTFVLSVEQEEICMKIAVSLLADDRREVTSAAMSVLTGIVAVLPEAAVSDLVSKYTAIANKSLKKKRRKTDKIPELTQEESDLAAAKEKERATRQQKSVFFLCAVVMGRPYDVPPYVPEALEALSKHSFEQRASLGVREVVKMCCSEFKRTHTDNWASHKEKFTQTQLEALEDVVSTPHYYA